MPKLHSVRPPSNRVTSSRPRAPEGARRPSARSDRSGEGLVSAPRRAPMPPAPELPPAAPRPPPPTPVVTLIERLNEALPATEFVADQLAQIADQYSQLSDETRTALEQALARWGLSPAGRKLSTTNLRELSAALRTAPAFVGALKSFHEAKSGIAFLEATRALSDAAAALPDSTRTRIERAFIAAGPGKAFAAVGISTFADFSSLTGAAAGAGSATAALYAALAAHPPDLSNAAAAAAQLGSALSSLPSATTERIQGYLENTGTGRLLARFGISSVEDLAQLLSLAPGVVEAVGACASVNTPEAALETLRGVADLVAALPQGMREKIERGLLGDATTGGVLSRAGFTTFAALRDAADTLSRALEALRGAEAAVTSRPPDFRRLADAASRLGALYEELPDAAKAELDEAFKRSASPFARLGFETAGDLARLVHLGPQICVHLFDLGHAALDFDAKAAGEAFAALTAAIGALPPTATAKLERACAKYLFSNHPLGKALASAGITSLSDLVGVLYAGKGAVTAIRGFVQCAVARDTAGAVREATHLFEHFAAVPQPVRERIGKALRDTPLGEGIARLLDLLPGDLEHVLTAAPALLGACAAAFAAAKSRDIGKALTAIKDACVAINDVPALRDKLTGSLAARMWEALDDHGRDVARQFGFTSPESIAPVLAGSGRVVGALADLWTAIASKDTHRTVVAAAALCKTAVGVLPPEFTRKVFDEAQRAFPFIRHVVAHLGPDGAAGIASALANPLVLANLADAADKFRRGQHLDGLGAVRGLLREALRGNVAMQRALLKALGSVVPGRVGKFLRGPLVTGALLAAGAGDRVLNVIDALGRGRPIDALREVALMVREIAMKNGRPDPEGMKLMAGLAHGLLDLLPDKAKAEALRVAARVAKRNVPVLGWAIAGVMAIPDAIELVSMWASGRATTEDLAFKAAELGLDVVGTLGPVGAAAAGAGGIVLGLLRAFLAVRALRKGLFGDHPQPAPLPTPATPAPATGPSG